MWYGEMSNHKQSINISRGSQIKMSDGGHYLPGSHDPMLMSLLCHWSNSVFCHCFIEIQFMYQKTHPPEV